MIDQRKISIAIPTYNRVEFTIDSFLDVLNDERVDEIVIVDDASELCYYNELYDICINLPKVKLYRNEKNQDCYRNKYIAITYCTNKWAILLDSDNKISGDYLDTIYLHSWFQDTILTPCFAKPHFNFEPYAGELISHDNVCHFIDRPMFEVCLNACNYFVNVSEYLRIWDGTVDPITSDSIYMISRWLEEGNKVLIVPELTYEHRVHEASHYKNNVHRTKIGFHEEILNKLKQMR